MLKTNSPRLEILIIYTRLYHDDQQGRLGGGAHSGCQWVPAAGNNRGCTDASAVYRSVYGALEGGGVAAEKTIPGSVTVDREKAGRGVFEYLASGER